MSGKARSRGRNRNPLYCLGRQKTFETRMGVTSREFRLENVLGFDRLEMTSGIFSVATVPFSRRRKHCSLPRIGIGTASGVLLC